MTRADWERHAQREEIEKTRVQLNTAKGKILEAGRVAKAQTADPTWRVSVAFTGRGWGKTTRSTEAIRKAEDRGEWVVIAGAEGFRCSRCHLAPSECQGRCFVREDEVPDGV